MEGISFIVYWVANPVACRRCVALNGQQWLIHDLEEVPLIYQMFTHPHCKCEVDIEINVDTEVLQVG